MELGVQKFLQKIQLSKNGVAPSEHQETEKHGPVMTQTVNMIKKKLRCQDYLCYNYLRTKSHIITLFPSLPLNIDPKPTHLSKLTANSTTSEEESYDVLHNAESTK